MRPGHSRVILASTTNLMLQGCPCHCPRHSRAACPLPLGPTAHLAGCSSRWPPCALPAAQLGSQQPGTGSWTWSCPTCLCPTAGTSLQQAQLMPSRGLGCNSEEGQESHSLLTYLFRNPELAHSRHLPCTCQFLVDSQRYLKFTRALPGVILEYRTEVRPEHCWYGPKQKQKCWPSSASRFSATLLLIPRGALSWER